MDGNSPDLATLVRSVAASGQRLARAQVALFQAEARETGQQVAVISAMAVVAAATGVLFGIFLLITIAYVLVALGLPTWAGFGIVTLVLLIVTAVFALVAKSRAEHITGPQVAQEELRRTKNALSSLGGSAQA